MGVWVRISKLSYCLEAFFPTFLLSCIDYCFLTFWEVLDRIKMLSLGLFNEWAIDLCFLLWILVICRGKLLNLVP